MGIGPTEIRIGFIFIFIINIIYGETFMARGLFYFLVLATCGLIIQVYLTQKSIWNIDMKEKAKSLEKK